MNIKELQTALEAMQQELTATKGAVTNLEGVNSAMTEDRDVQRARHEELMTHFANVVESQTALNKNHEALIDRLDLLESERGALVARIEDLELKVNGRNKSAATKRNMTDADAIRVMTGDLKELSHKDAAETIGLTYAQVYSCRGEFTFKDVHKELREGGWKNPWAK